MFQKIRLFIKTFFKNFVIPTWSFFDIPVLFVLIFGALYFSYDYIVEKVTLEQADKIIQFSQVVIWPTLIFSFITIFKEQLKSFLTRMDKIKILNAEANAPQYPLNPIENKVEIDSLKITLTSDQIKNIEQGFADLQNENVTKDENIRVLNEALKYSMALSERYEFILLDIFFVYNTKQALKWIKDSSIRTREDFFINFLPSTSLQGQYFPKTLMDEKLSILEALKSSLLISEDRGTLIINAKGERYLEHLTQNKLIN